MSLFKRNTFLLSEKGNIFFAIFGAIALIGVVGTVVITTMRGPLSTMVEVQNRTQAESEMAIASRLALLEATELAASGDCDGDGFVEPLEWIDAGGAGPAGGGFLPSEVASSRLDPWGTEYGYCAWDAGNVIDAMACDINSDTNYYRLDGNGDPNDETYTIIAVISAGPDQVFGTTCTGGASPDVTRGGDDIVTEFTYQGAVTATNGLWNLKSGDPTTAEINKNLEVVGGASFTDGIDLTGSASALQLGAASMLFPTEATLATCNAANNGLIRINTTTNPDTLEVCDNTFGGWVSVGGSGIWISGAGDDIYYNTGTPQVGIGTTTPDDTLDVVGTLDVSGAVSFGSTLGVTGTSSLADTTVTTLGATGAVDFDSTLNVDGASTLVGAIDAQGAISSSTGDVSLSDDVVISGTLDAQGDVSDSTGDFTVADNLVVTGTSDLQGAVSDSTGDLTLGDSIVITGTTDARGAISNSTGNVDISDSLDVSNDLDVDGSADVDGTMEADDYTWNGNDFTPATCAAGNFNRWDGTSWSCDVDTSGSGGGGTNAGVFEDTGAAPTVIRMKSSIGTDYSDVDFVFGSPTLSAPADPNYYERFLFDKSLGAFRAGRSGAGSWDTANLGQYSFAGGADNTASGDYSTAFGGSSSATGSHSFAAGSSIASGDFSTATGGSTTPGYKSQATGRGSAAMGIATTASGNFSVAMGVTAVAGDAQFTAGDAAQGSLDATVGEGSFAFGLADAATAGAYADPTEFPRVTGDRSFGIFMGDQTNVDFAAANTMGLFGGKLVIDPAVPATNLAASTGGVQDLELDVEGDIGAINYCDEDGNNCFAPSDVGGSGSGIWEIASNVTRIKSTAGDYSADDFVFGSPQLDDSGDSDHDARMFFDKSKGAFRVGTAIGTEWDDISVGLNSIGLGNSTIASGNGAISIGDNTVAGNDNSIAFGDYVTSTGQSSLALGTTAIASGDFSTALGLGLATGAYPVVSGASSLGIFMGDQSGYDLATANRMALVGGDFLIDDDGTAGSQGCIRYLEGTGLQYSDDCTTFSAFNAISGGVDTLIDADGDTQIQVEEGADDDTIRFDTAGSERMVVLPTGEVGIGTDTPASTLHVNTTDNSTDTFITISGGLDGSAVSLVGHRLRETLDYGFNTYYDSNDNDLIYESVVASTATERWRMQRSDGALGLGDFDADTIDSALHLQSGDIRLDGGAANEAGCIRFNDTTDVLEYSDDCSTYSTFASLGGATALSDITDATAANTLTNGVNLQTWNWALTGAGSAFTFGENTAATGGSDDQYILSAETLATSTAIPFFVNNLGAGDSFRVDDASGDTTPFVIDADGNVGIGTASPAKDLEIEDLTGSAATIRLQSADNNDTEIEFIEALVGVKIRYEGNANSLHIEKVDESIQYMTFLRDSGYVGIGTVSPASMLHLETGDIRLDGGAANEAGCLRFDDTTDKLQFSNDCTTFTNIENAGTGLWTAGTGDDIYYNATTPQVGIGTTSPSVDLEIYNDTTSPVLRISTDAVGTNDPTIVLNTNGSDKGSITFDNSESNLYIGNAYNNASTDGNIRLVTGGYTEAQPILTLEAKDNAGIGIHETTPDAYLEIAPDPLTGTADYMMISSAAANDGDVFVVDSSGNIGINETAPTGGRLHITGDTDAAADTLIHLEDDRSALINIQGGTNTFGGGINFQDSASNNQYQFYINGGGTDLIFTSNQSGGRPIEFGTNITEFILSDSRINVGIGEASPDVALDVAGDIEYTGTITDVSDMRLKDNIEPLTKTGSLLERIDQIDTYSFTMKGDEKHRTEYGVMAQELETIFPDLVHTAKDEMGTKSVNYIGLIAPMIEATKELRAENAALKAEQNATKDALQDLSKQVALLNRVVVKDNTREGSANYMLFLLIFMLGGMAGFAGLRLKRS